METKMENLEMSTEVSQNEISKLKRSLRNHHIFYNVFYLTILVIVILLLRDCSGKKITNLEAQLQAKTDSINLLNKKLAECENRKAVPVVNDTVINKVEGKFVVAVIVSPNDNRSSSVFLPKEIKRIPYRVEVPAPCPVDSSAIIMWQDCAKANDGLVGLIVEMDSLLSDSLAVCMDKQYREDSTVIMMQKKMQLRAFLLNPSPSINYSNKYIEYIKNPWRLKSERAFWRGVGSGLVSIGLYATSEALGNPIFIDGQDNSNAQRKSDAIFWLRAGSLATGLYSGFEFSRTIYFHNMETRFIVDPTTLKLVLYLDK